MRAILEKLLIEDDFLTDFLLKGKSVIMKYEDLLPEHIEQLLAIRQKTINFFGGADMFDENIHNEEFWQQVIEYSKEKYTYMFASIQSSHVQLVVWVS